MSQRSLGAEARVEPTPGTQTESVVWQHFGARLVSHMKARAAFTSLTHTTTSFAPFPFRPNLSQQLLVVVASAEQPLGSQMVWVRRQRFVSLPPSPLIALVFSLQTRATTSFALSPSPLESSPRSLVVAAAVEPQAALQMESAVQQHFRVPVVSQLTAQAASMSQTPATTSSVPSMLLQRT